MKRKWTTLLLICVLCATFAGGCGGTNNSQEDISEVKEHIEYTLNLANSKDQEWAYMADADAWVLSVVSAVAYPELPGQQGVSVCVPGGYVTGIDVDGDGKSDITAKTFEDAVKGSLVIDYVAEIVSANGQIYTAATAPVILNTGAAGYGSSQNSTASAIHTADGYINVSCGNRGKQDTATDENSNTYYTGDAPSCLVDQKSAARYVKYNILLGNLPGSVDYFVSTGGSGGGAHAVMFAATSNHPDFYDYQIKAGAVGVYKSDDGSYSTTVSVDGVDYELSDGAWGCIAYSAITSLYEADMAQSFEYFLNTDYNFDTSFQTQLAEYLSAAYMEYINGQKLTVEESAIGADLNGDGNLNATIALTIEYDPAAYPETNGYYGTYLDFYLAEFTRNLQWYLDNLDYAEGWTWFDDNGKALSDEAVAAMTAKDKSKSFIKGLYAKGNSGDRGGPGNPGGPGSGVGDPGDIGIPGDTETRPGDAAPINFSNEITPGDPDEGATRPVAGKKDSVNYETYSDMLAAYEADIEEIYAGDKYDNNIVLLYNPLEYIGAKDTENPAWSKILMGAAEGDISMFNSLNLQIAWLNAGVNADLEWQWNGGHVPSETLGDSFSLYVDQMYGKYVNGAVTVVKAPASVQTTNGDAEEANGTDISNWVRYDDITNIGFTLADAAAYRAVSASKVVPGFDVIDYGQEDYVFGNTEADARHWNIYLIDIFKKHADVLESLFNN
jgi:hypothetical protein